jgi:hypothetical protein
MKHIFLTLLLATLCATGHGQTVKTLGYTTNGNVVYTGTNKLIFTNPVDLGIGAYTSPILVSKIDAATAIWDVANDEWAMTFIDGEPQFNGTNRRDEFRNGIAAARAPIWKYKATNQTNSTTNLASDTALTFTAAANTKYAVTLFIMIQSVENLVGNISSTNSTVYGYWNTVAENLNFVPTSAPLTNANTFFLADGGAAAATQKFTVVGGTNSGSVTFQFHGAVTSEPAIIGAGSYLKAEVIE